MSSAPIGTKLKILNIITTIDLGGAENQLLIQARELVNLGHEVSVMPLKGNLDLLEAFELAKVDVNLLIWGRNPLFQIFKLRRFFSDNSIELLHGHLPRAEILIWAAKLFTKRNFIITRHNAEPFVPFLPIQISSWLSRILIAKGRSTIAISDSVKRYLQKEGEVDSDADISIIKYCYDPTVKRLRPKTLGSSDIVTKFVSVARLEKQKNLEVLLAGFSKYRTRYGAGTLDIFGSGSEREKLVEMCKSLGIDSYVEFRGKVNDIPSTISRYQCFLLTSKYEGFGLVLLEAMQCGLPIICSDAEALVEVVGSQYEGFFKIGEDEQLFHQMTLINNSETYNERAEYCSGRLEYFSPTKTLNDLLYVYLRNKSASKD